MSRQRQLIWVGLSVIFGFGCAKSIDGSTDSETHFLFHCKDSCAEGLACICEVCTKTCEDDESCGALTGDARCVAPELLNGMRDCRPSDPIDESVCDVECKSDTECKASGKDFSCRSGFCRESAIGEPDNATTRDAGSRRRDSSVISFTLDSSTDVEEVELTLPDLVEDDASYPFVLLEPTISGGLAPGERAPKPGEVPANVYGGPQEPYVISVNYPHFDSTQSFEPAWNQPEYREKNPPPESRCDNGWGSADVGYLNLHPCVIYYLCSQPCERDSDCDDGGSGNAVPVCTDPYCDLLCDQGRSCPDGMVCLTVDDRASCFWPIDAIVPGCPAWCDLQPTPQGCPGWCAQEGVGCPEGDEDYCCQGLVCGPDGFCIEESAS